MRNLHGGTGKARASEMLNIEFGCSLGNYSLIFMCAAVCRRSCWLHFLSLDGHSDIQPVPPSELRQSKRFFFSGSDKSGRPEATYRWGTERFIWLPVGKWGNRFKMGPNVSSVQEKMVLFALETVSFNWWVGKPECWNCILRKIMVQSESFRFVVNYWANMRIKKGSWFEWIFF